MVQDSLQTIIDLVAFLRDCKETPSRVFEIWLLHNEVLALTGLEQYEEASALVSQFFDIYFDEAPDRYRARFYLWRLNLNALDGAVLDMVRDYAEAQRYAGALDAWSRASLYLDGAYAYLEIDQYETALRLTEQAQELVAVPESYEERNAASRALLLGAEAQLWLGTQLEQVKDKLLRASRIYGSAGDTAKVAIATTLLGMTYAAEGDTSVALAEMSKAVGLAQTSGAIRSETYALYRQGQLLRKSRDFDAAEPVLLQALKAAESCREFYLEAAYELARFYEQRREYKKAISFYQTVLDAPKRGNPVATLEAERKAQAGKIRLLLIEQEQSHWRLRLALAGIVLLLGLVGAGLYVHWRRRAIYDQIRESIVLPEHLKTGLTLRALVRRFQRINDSELLGKRLAYIYAVLFDPQLVLDYIDDPYLRPQVEDGSVENNTALFECVAAVEQAVVERTFRGNAANTMRSYLLREFRRRDWKWPKNPLAWKRHFLEHHIKTLF